MHRDNGQARLISAMWNCLLISIGRLGHKRHPNWLSLAALMISVMWRRAVIKAGMDWIACPHDMYKACPLQKDQTLGKPAADCQTDVWQRCMMLATKLKREQTAGLGS